MSISLIHEGLGNMCLIKLHLQFVCLSCVPKRFSAEEEMVHIFWAVLHNWKMLGIKWNATIQVCVRVNASTFFAGMRRLEKTFFVHLAKVGEWKQHGMNAGPQSAVSGMCWREPETRPNPHSQLKRTQAHAYTQKSAYSCTNTPENC